MGHDMFTEERIALEAQIEKLEKETHVLDG
jgi:hypothetical protein